MRLLASLFLVLSSVIATAQETLIRQVHDTKTDTHVEITSLFSKPSAEGFFPIRVKVANNQKVAHFIRLEMSSTSSYRSGTRTASEFSISAPAGKVTTRDLLVPLNAVADTYQSNVYLEVKLSGSMGSQAQSVSADYGHEQPSVLMSEPLYSVNASQVDSEVAKVISTFGGGNFSSRFDAGQLPDNWLAFSGFDAAVMLDSDWTSMPGGSRNAMLSWLRLGGHLVIYSYGSPSPVSLGIPEDISLGTVSILPISTGLSLDAPKLVQHLITDNKLQTHRFAMVGDFKTAWPLYKSIPEKPFRYVLFIVVLLAFGVLVGPINLFVFAKSGRRHLLFLTTPIISLATSLLLIALILFQDGFGGNGKRLALMEVPAGPADNAAFILQEQVSRTGVLTRSAFQLGTPSFLSPTPMDDNRWTRFNNSQTDGNYQLQPNGGVIDASGDWFQSRSMQGQTIASVIPTRGRIERVAGSGQLISTFDFPLEKLYYLDANGQWFLAEKVETGKSFQLTPLDESLVKPQIDALESEFSRRNALLFGRARERKDHFIAVASSAPLIDTHPGIRWDSSRTILTGGIATP